MKQRLTIIVTILLAMNAGAATYYVDFAAGNNANTGLSFAQAWKHCPGGSGATAVAGSTPLQSGDVVRFNHTNDYVQPPSGFIRATNGVTYIGNWTGNPAHRCQITDERDHTVTYGFLNQETELTGAKFLDFEIGPLSGVLPADNAALYGIGGSATPWPLTGGIAAAPAFGMVFNRVNGVMVSNVYFHELGFWQNVKPIGFLSIDGIAFKCIDSVGAGLVITNCEITKVALGIEIPAYVTLTNIDIGGNYLHDYIVWGIDMPAVQAGCVRDFIYIHHNRFFNIGWAYDANYWTAYGSEGPHQNAIFNRCDSASNDANNFRDGTNINFNANHFKLTTNNITGGTAGMYMVNGPSFNAYNQLFENYRSANGAIVRGDDYVSRTNARLCRIFHHTFIQDQTPSFNGTGQPIYPHFYKNDEELVEVFNNVFKMITPVAYIYGVSITSTQLGATAVSSTIKFNGNAYDTENPYDIIGNWSNYPDYGYFGFQAAGYANIRGLGWETNGFHTNINLNASFQPTNGSPLFNAGILSAPFSGTTWTNLPGANVDFAGNTRHFGDGTSPTIGAFEGEGDTDTGEPPPTPSVVALAGIERANLMWSAVAEAETYHLKYGTTSGSLGTFAQTSGTTYTVSGLAQGIRVYVSVLASNANGASAWSAEANCVPGGRGTILRIVRGTAEKAAGGTGK